MRFVKGGRILIVADSNSQSKTWHNLKTNSRGTKLEEYPASKHLHILNEGSDMSTFLNSRGSSNIDLSITYNSLIAAVNDWKINEEASLSDLNHLKYKISGRGVSKQNNVYKSQGTAFIIKQEKLLFPLETSSGNVKTANNTHFEGGTQEPDEYLSTVITAEIDLEQQVDLFTETVQSACCTTFQNTTTRK